MNQLGLRFGLIWHIESFIQNKQKEREDKIKAAEEAKRQAELERLRLEAEAADEAEKARIEAELRKAEEEQKAREEAERLKREAEEARRAEIASWPNPTAVLKAEGAKNFTPDGDGLNDTVTFVTGIEYVEETPDSWVISIKDPQGHDFKTFKGNGLPPASVVWDGKSDKGENVVSKNTYTVLLTVTPSKTDRLRTKELTAETKITVNTGLILDVIVPEHEWKIEVQSIAFDPDAASFNKLSEDQVKSNHETLDEVAQQIKDHPGSNVIVEGYANNVSGTEKEEKEELIPLSQKRAEAIVDELVKRGIDREILTAKGMGGANPLATRRDRDNWWKNRRVEFRIVK
ncbi:OmpA family protein [Treponema sp.]|uniref:OmpA family protein n=1 Tax=Treponema sp. TaxID=166 RepID=UPI00388D5EAD